VPAAVADRKSSASIVYVKLYVCAFALPIPRVSAVFNLAFLWLHYAIPFAELTVKSIAHLNHSTQPQTTKWRDSGESKVDCVTLLRKMSVQDDLAVVSCEYY